MTCSRRSRLDLTVIFMTLALLLGGVVSRTHAQPAVSYRPVIVDAADPGVKQHTYRLGGMTCLAGDVIGDYSFDRPLAVGDKLVFLDMAHYTMVKTTTFNGVRLPSIATHDPKTGTITVSRRFGYADYRDRLS